MPTYASTNTSPAAFSAPQAPIAPYTPLFSGGVPSSRPSIHSTRGTHRSRHHPYATRPVHRPPPQQTLTFDVMLYPSDIRDGPYDFRLHHGEQLRKQFQHLAKYGCSTHVTIQATGSESWILPDVYRAIHEMIVQGRVELPSNPDTNFDLPSTEPNRDYRVQYQRLPFRVLSAGNRSAYGRTINPDTEGDSWSRFQFFAFKKLVMRIPHPALATKGGVLLICPKGGELRGHIPEDPLDVHACFARRITYYLSHGKEDQINCTLACPRFDHIENSEGLSESTSREENSPVSHPSSSLSQPASSFVRSSSLSPLRFPPPLAPFSLQLPTSSLLLSLSPVLPASESAIPSTVSSIPPISIVSSASVSSSVSQVSAQLASSSASSISTVSVSASPAILVPSPVPTTETSSTSSASSVPLSLDASPNTTHNLSSAHRPPIYEPLIPPTFNQFIDIEHLLRNSGAEELHNTFWHVRGNSVDVCSKGLVTFLIHSRHSTDPFIPQSLPSFSIYPEDIKLNDIWCMHWSFKAGISMDSSGDGVMRQVLAHAIAELCGCICGDPKTTTDHYAHLQIVQFSEESFEDRAFALGVLCAMFLVRAHAAPLPISPILLQYIFGDGIASLDDEPWLRSICPDAAHGLSLFPRSTGLAQDFSHLSDADRRLLEGMLHHVDKNNLMQLSRTRQAQWPRMIQTLLVSVLLDGARPFELDESSYHIAFKEGLDRPCSTTVPSFLSLMKNSSKALLYHAYSMQRLLHPNQLTPLVEFELVGSDTFKSEVVTLLPSIKNHFWRYFRGIGHPRHFVPDLISRAQYLESQHQCYRATRFLQVLSGISLLPANHMTFSITINENINSNATFNRTYNIDTDLLIPITHACTYQMDLFVNTAFKTFFQQPMPDDTSVFTEFDRILHIALFDAGTDSFNA